MNRYSVLVENLDITFKIKQVYLPFLIGRIQGTSVMLRPAFRLFLFLLLVLLFQSACTTTKNTPVHRAWHNMNARYNGHFLAGEELKETIRLIEREHQEDYSRLLPVFIYPRREDTAKYAASFDKVVKRSTGVIERHTIVSPKGKVEIANACKWIDENYTMIGISNMYQQEFVPALEIFQYVNQKYPDPEAKYRGQLWIMRIYNELGSLTKTEIAIDDLKNNEAFPKKKAYTHHLALIAADCAIKRGNKSLAIEYLKEAIATTRKKKHKARYYYIMAQLYTQTGQYDDAIASYQKVLKNHPVYETVFNARISKANLYALKDGDNKAIKRELIHMSKDLKNTEYLDQIYYSLALITYKETDTATTLMYLAKSIENSTANIPKKAQAYLKRGDIYFDKQNYKVSEINYDSALAALPEDYPGYMKILDKKKTLSALVLNLNSIHTQDSLLALSKMSEKEREKAVDKMIAYLEKEELRKQEEEKIRQENAQRASSTTATTIIAPVGPSSPKLWYFYNPTTVSMGVADFNKKWGSRKLEDDWRRSQKEQSSDSSEEESEAVDPVGADSLALSEIRGLGGIQSRDYYLKTIPRTPEDLKKSEKIIIDAFYNVGVIYKEQLNNNAKSVEAFEELLKRYPDNNYQLTVYYQLYRSYLSLKNNPKAEYYKNILLDNYPDSEYAKIIRNPEYAKNLRASKSEIEDFYTQTYELYTAGNYYQALENCKRADSVYAKNDYSPLFDFIKAMSIGYTQDIKAFEVALNRVVTKHSMHPIKEKAQIILDLIKNKTLEIDSIRTDIGVADTIKNTTYYWIAIINTEQSNINKFKEKLELITQNTFTTPSLNIKTDSLNEKNKIVSVQEFADVVRAKDYYRLMESTTQLFVDLRPNTYVTMLISEYDYPLLLQNKAVENYLNLFNEKIK